MKVSLPVVCISVTYSQIWGVFYKAFALDLYFTRTALNCWASSFGSTLKSLWNKNPYIVIELSIVARTIFGTFLNMFYMLLEQYNYL